jgi:hypothetical protein
MQIPQKLLGRATQPPKVILQVGVICQVHVNQPRLVQAKISNPSLIGRQKWQRLFQLGGGPPFHN